MLSDRLTPNQYPHSGPTSGTRRRSNASDSTTVIAPAPHTWQRNRRTTSPTVRSPWAGKLQVYEDGGTFRIVSAW